MATEKSFHMSPDEFRRHGHAVVDWIADYYTRIESFPVLSRAEPGQIRASLPPDPPAQGESFPTILADIEKLILPGVTHWQSPNFYAYFPSNASGPGILGDLLSSGLGVQGMLWATSPACTELETHVLDWLVQMLDLPQNFLSTSSGGVIQDTASSVSVRPLAARERATNLPAMLRAAMANWWPTLHRKAHLRWRKARKLPGSKNNLRAIDVDENSSAPERSGSPDRARSPRWPDPIFSLRYGRHHVLQRD
jgi:aromatic-L-amino-acid decarboxylase